MQDALGNTLTCASASAAAAYDRAVDAHLHAWPGALEGADEALREAPDLALAHALRALVLAGRALGAQALDAVARARAAAPGASAREQSQVDLVAAIVEGRGPTMGGALLGAGMLAAPLIVCGGLKIAYDLALLASFRRQRVE